MLVAVINCAVEGCSLLDMISILLIDDVALTDTETFTFIDDRKICLLLEVALVSTTDVELSSLLVTLIAEATVCTELSSLLDISMVNVLDNEKVTVVLFDILLVTDGTDSCSVVLDNMAADLLVDAAVTEITSVAVVTFVGA